MYLCVCVCVGVCMRVRVCAHARLCVSDGAYFSKSKCWPSFRLLRVSASLPFPAEVESRSSTPVKSCQILFTPTNRLMYVNLIGECRRGYAGASSGVLNESIRRAIHSMGDGQSLYRLTPLLRPQKLSATSAETTRYSHTNHSDHSSLAHRL